MTDTRKMILTVIIQNVVDAVNAPGARATFRTVRVPLSDEQADALRRDKWDSFVSAIVEEIDDDGVGDHE